MAKTNNNPTTSPDQNLFPDIGRERMKLSTGLSNVLKSNGIDPVKLQENIYSLYDAGGDNRLSAIQNVAGINSRYGNDNTLTNILRSQSQPLTEQEVAAQTGSVDTWQAIKAGVWNSSVPMLAEGVAQVGNALYGAGENLFTGDTRQAADNRKNIENYFDNWKVYIDNASQVMPVSLDANNKIDWSNIGNVKSWSYLLSSGVGFMLPGVVTGGATVAASGLARAAGSAATAANILNKGRLAGSAISTLQMYPGIQKEAMDNGLTFGQSSLFSAVTSPVLGAVEQMSFGSMMRGFGLAPSQAKAAVKNLTREAIESEVKNLGRKGFNSNTFREAIEAAGRKTGKNITDGAKVGMFANVAKGVKGTAAAFGNRLTRGMVEGGGVEAMEELLQGGIEYSAQEIYNNWIAAEGTSAGDGQFDTDFKESSVNTIMGALAAGIIGTSMGSFYRGQRGLEQTLYSFVKSDINNKLLNGATSLDQILQGSELESVVNAARDSGQFNNEKGELDQAAYDNTLRRGRLLYETAYQFKDYTGIDGQPMDDNTIFSMYRIAESKDGLTVRANGIQQNINQLSEYDTQIEEAANTGNTVVAERLRAEKSKLSKTLGTFNQQTGKYAVQEQLEADAVKYNTLFDNAVSAITDEDPNVRSRGNFMLKSGLSALKNETFIPTNEVTLSDGRVMVRGNNDSEGVYFRELVEQPIEQRPANIPSVSEQIDKGKYTPVPRVEYSTEPVTDYDTYSQMVETFDTPAKVRKARNTNNTHSEEADMQDLLGEIGGRVTNYNSSPIKDYEGISKQVDNAYKVYRGIVKSAGVNESNALTPEQFDTAVGFQRQGVISTIADELGSITTIDGLPIQVNEQGDVLADLEEEISDQPTIEDIQETVAERNADLEIPSANTVTEQEILDSLSKSERDRLINDIIPSTERDVALLYFAQGNKVHPDLIKNIFSQVRQRQTSYSTGEFGSRLNFIRSNSPVTSIGSLGETLLDFANETSANETSANETEFDSRSLANEGEDIILGNTGIRTIQNELIIRNYPDLFESAQDRSSEESIFTPAGEQVDNLDQELSDEITTSVRRGFSNIPAPSLSTLINRNNESQPTSSTETTSFVPVEEGTRVSYGGYVGTLSMEGIRPVIIQDNGNIVEIEGSVDDSGNIVDLRGLGVNPITSQQSFANRYESSNVTESGITINGQDYEYELSDNGNIIGLRTTDGRGQILRNDRLLTFAEIERNKLDYNRTELNNQTFDESLNNIDQNHRSDIERITSDAFINNAPQDVQEGIDNILSENTHLSLRQLEAIVTWVDTIANKRLNNLLATNPDSSYYQSLNELLEGIKKEAQYRLSQYPNNRSVRFNVTDVSENNVTINNINYTIDTGSNGNITSLTDENGYRTTNEDLIIAAEIAINKISLERVLDVAEIGDTTSTDNTQNREVNDDNTQNREVNDENAQRVVNDVFNITDRKLARSVDRFLNDRNMTDTEMFNIYEWAMNNRSKLNDLFEIDPSSVYSDHINILDNIITDVNSKYNERRSENNTDSETSDNGINENQQFTNQEIDNGEEIDTAGDQDIAEESPSIESAFLEEQEQEELNELFGDEGIELSRQLEAANEFAENAPSGTFSEEYIAEFARQLDEANRAIESEHATAESLIGQEGEQVTTTSGNTDISEEGSTAKQVTVDTADPNYVPFDASTSEKGAGTPIGNNLISKLVSAFPNVGLNISSTVDEYLNVLNSIPTVRQVFDKNNKPYGFVNPVDGKIYIDPSRVNGNTLIHEYGHIWLMTIRDTDLYGRGTSLIQNSPYMQEVRNNPAYNGLNETQLAEEALAHAIADKGTRFLTSGKRQSIGNFISELFDRIKQFFGIKSNVPSDITLDEFLNDAVENILSGNNISEITSADVIGLMGMQTDPVIESATTNQYGNPDSVVSYPEEGTSMTGENLRENLISTGDILLAASRDERLEVDQNNPETGEMYGTWEERRQVAIDELTSLGIMGLDEGSISQFESDISRIAARTGYRYEGRKLTDAQKKAIRKAKKEGTYVQPSYEKGVDRLSFQNSNEVFYTGDGKIVTLAVGGSGNEPGRVVQMMSKALDKYESLNPDTVLGKVGRSVLKSGLESGFNLETLSQMLGFDRLLKDAKRAGEKRLSYMRTAAGAELERLKILMAPYSTFHNVSNMDVVEKMEINVIEWSDELGRGVDRTITVPKAVGMQILRGVETQLSTAEDNPDYLIKNGLEEHATAVLDNSYTSADGRVSSLAPKDAFYGTTLSRTAGGATSKVKKGVHLDARFVRETDSKGNLVQARDVDGKNTGELAVMISQNEYERLSRRFNEGVGVDSDQEVEAYKAAKEFFNNKVVSKMLEDENNNYLNPDDPFTVVRDYAPIRPITRIHTDARLDAFSPGIEDFRILQDRKTKPDAVWGSDILADANSYLETAGYVVGNGRLIHNMEAIRNAISTDYDGSFKNSIDKVLKRDIEQFNNYQKYLARSLSEGMFIRGINKYINRYTPYIFTFNLGTGLKNLGTLFSSIGQGHVDTDILTAAFRETALRARNILTDIDVEADIVEGTTRGRVGALRGQTALEDQEVSWLLGEHINDPDAKAKHRELWAVVINRAIFGQNQYVQGVDFTSDDLFKKGGAKSAQGISFVRNFMDRYGMGFIKRADRNVIFSFVNAARKQAQRDVDNGVISSDQMESRAADIATNLVYETNQMNMVTDLTGLQRTSSLAAKLIGIYTGQPQKIMNQMVQNFDAYIKLLSSGNTEAIKAARERLLYSVVSNVGINSMYMAGVTVGWRALRAVLSGDDLPDEDEMKEQFVWNTLLNMGGAFPGTVEQISSVVISMADNMPWQEELISIPGADLIMKSGQAVVDYVKNEDPSKTEKYRDNIWNTVPNVISIGLGMPKVVTDLTKEWITEDADDRVRKGVNW